MDRPKISIMMVLMDQYPAIDDIYSIIKTIETIVQSESN
jgi:hypothetical protein